MPLHFNHDFRQDLEQVHFTGEPYALIRFGDGERAFCTGSPMTSSAERWHFDGKPSSLSQYVLRAATQHIPGINIGISCPCCDRPAAVWYREHAGTPPDQVTYANIFVNANYQRFMQKFGVLKRSDYVLVACRNGDITVPSNAINPPVCMDTVVKEMLRASKLILVAAGPVKCELILRYWEAAKDKQIVVDVGSALDPIIHGKGTRRYHTKGSPTSIRSCVWKL